MGLTPLQCRELNKLLDKYERRRDYGSGTESGRRTMLRIEERAYPGYFNISDGSYRRQFNLEMEDLESRGFVELEWERFQQGDSLRRIALKTEALDRIYGELDRTSKKDRFEALALLAERWRADSPQQLDRFYGDFFRRCRSLETLPAPLSGFSEDDFADLFKALQALFQLEKEIPKRRFSVQLYGNSKRWDDVEKAVLWVLKTHYLKEGECLLDKREILSEWGVLDNPQHINISGPIIFKTPAEEVNVRAFYPDLGLAPQMVSDMEITGLNASAVVTVENLTSFYHYVDEGPENHLVIYLGGYHNTSRRSLLCKIYEYCRCNGIELPFFHWGDLDFGGITIWHHLRKGTGIPFRPLMMDVDTFLAYEKFGCNFSSGYGKKLEKLLKNEDFAPFHELIKLMLEKKRRVEQEAVTSIVKENIPFMLLG